MLPPLLDQIIQAIAGFASPIIKDKIQRSEVVIKILQQFKLDPEHPPSDFSGVYAYALVEYGVGRPKPLLELFRHEEVKQAFRKALDHNNPSILLSEVDTFLDTYNLGSEVHNLGLNVRREVAEFVTVFIEVAKRSRTPGDVLMSHQLGSLHKHIASIQEQLSRLPNLEGIRTEIARLAAENYSTLPGVSAFTENNCKAISLAQQMRGWFETLGYRFEKDYEIWHENYFEWIINIPVRRNRYDRILVRGIAGEVGLGDVIALRQSIETQCTDEGWLITARRISRAARSEVKKEENRHLECYTFDELLAQDADFSGYLDWLEMEVKQRKIDTRYVPLACNKEEIDPVTKQPVVVSHYSEQDGWIDGYIDRWLDDPAKEHISILGEFGTGKTWFALHYAWVTLQRFRDAKKRGTELPRLPLVIPLRDYAKAVSVESLFSEFFFRKYKIPLPHYDAFIQLNRMGKLLLIFDGFDEMAARVNRQEMINNFWELAKVVVPGAKVILTCRTEHFPEAYHGRALLNAELRASTANLTGETPQFEVLELEKFNDEQIRLLLSHQTETATVEQVMSNPQLLDLARRPVMTELILSALPDIEAGKPVDMSRVYLYAVQRKIQRDIKQERTFTSLAEKLYFLCELSWEMLSTDQMSLNYKFFPERIRRLFGVVEKDLDHWHFDMMGQTMLTRNADGDYTPAHRSLLEFFVAYKFVAELGLLAFDFTELAKVQSFVDGSASPKDYTWSDYFSCQLDGTGRSVIKPPLRGFRNELLDKLRETFGLKPLTKALMDLLLPMIDIEKLEGIVKLIKATKGRSEDEVGYVGGNAVTLAVKIDKASLEGKDFSRTVIVGADFTGARLRHVNFTEAKLLNSCFTRNLGKVVSVAFSPINQCWATGDSDGMIRIWKLPNGREVLAYKGHNNLKNDNSICSISFSSDGKKLVSSGDDCLVKVWEVITGKHLQSLQGYNGIVYSLSFSPDNKTIVGGCKDYVIRVWDVNTGECLKELNGHTGRVFSVVFSPDGQKIISGGDDKIARLWDVCTGECIQTFTGHVKRINAVSLSSDGSKLASAGDLTVRLWNTTTGECLKILKEHNSGVSSVAFNTKNSLLASGSGDHKIKLWDLCSGLCLKTLNGHTRNVSSITFDTEGDILISGSLDSTIRIWDVNKGDCLRQIQSHNRLVYSVTLSSDGSRLASSGDDHMIKIWDTYTGECIRDLQGHTNSVNSVSFSPDYKFIASCSDDCTLKLWDYESGKCLNTFYGHTKSITSVVFHSNGKLLASSSIDSKIRIWNLEDGKCIRVIDNPGDKICSVVFLSNGHIIASAGTECVVKLWDFVTGECIQIFQGHQDTIRYLALNANGNLLASAGFDYTIMLWDINTKQCVKTMKGENRRIRTICFHADGENIVSGDDETVKIWNISTGKCIKVLEGHDTYISSVAYSLNNNILASGSWDGTIKIWDINTGDCLKTLVDKPYERMNITGIKGLTRAEKVSLKSLGAVED